MENVGMFSGDGHLVGRRLRGEGDLMRPCESLSPVFLGKTQSGETTVEEDALQLPGPRSHLVDRHQFPAVVLALGEARHIVRQPGPGAEAERLDLFCTCVVRVDADGFFLQSESLGAMRSR